MADTVEALLGAVYIDQGLAVAAELVHRLFDGLIAAASSMGAGLDWKTSLQELAALRGVGVPRYSVAESGPDHQKSFVATVHMGEVDFGQGQGKNKKEAEQAAAQAAWQVLTEQPETLPAGK